jgi:hypothetical protein
MFSYYALFEQLPDEVKQAHGIKMDMKNPRFDLIKASGEYPPFDTLKNNKGMLILRLIDPRGIINSTDQRRAGRALQGRRGKDTINFTSLFIPELPTAEGEPMIGFGNPNGNPTLKNGNPNPFAGYGNDGFLFIVSPDWKRIELLVMPDGNLTTNPAAKALADGVYDSIVQAARAAATTFYDYWKK